MFLGDRSNLLGFFPVLFRQLGQIVRSEHQQVLGGENTLSDIIAIFVQSTETKEVGTSFRPLVDKLPLRHPHRVVPGIVGRKEFLHLTRGFVPVSQIDLAFICSLNSQLLTHLPVHEVNNRQMAIIVDFETQKR